MSLRSPRGGTRALALGLALLGLLALLAWFGWELRAGAPEGARRAAAAAPLDAQLAGQLAASEAPAVDAQRGTVDGARIALEAAQLASSEDPDALVLLCVRADNGAAVPHAELALGADIFRDDDYPIASARHSDLFDVLVELGARVASADAKGELRVAREAGNYVFAARSAGLWARGYASFASASPLRIELWPDSSVCARVVDARGEPVAGVPVALRQRWGAGTYLAWQGRSDERGIARVEHLAGIQAYEGDSLYTLGLAVPLARPVEAELPRRGLPSEPLTLVLPPTGSLLVRVLDAAGAPLKRSGALQLSVARGERGQEEGAERPPRARDDSYSTVPVEAGLAELPFVGLGLELDLQLTLAGRIGASARVSGPQAAGARAEAELRPADPAWRLRGRALDAAGAPIAGGSIVLTLSSAGSSISAVVRSDSDGRFDQPVEGLRDPGPLEVHAWLLETGPRRAARASARITGADLELGELCFRALPELAEGRVIDERGEPVAGAHVSVRREQPRQLGPRRGGTDWSSANTDARGHFSVSATEGPEWPLGSAARLQVGGPHSQPVPALPIALGQRGLEIVLPRAGELRGYLAPRGALPLDSFGLRLQRQQAEEQAHTSSAEYSGTFSIGSLVPGRYRFELLDPRWSDTPEHERDALVLLHIDDIEISADSVCRDERLQGLAVPPPWEGLALRVLDAEGAPIDEAHAWIFDPARRSSGWIAHQVLDGGAGDLAVAQLPCDLELWAAGARPLRVRALDASRELRLEPGIPLALWIDGLSTAAGEQLRISVSLAQERPEDPQLCTWQSEYGCSLSSVELRNPFKLRVPEPARYEVAVELVGSAGQVELERVPAGGANAIVEVLDLAGGTEAHLEFRRRAPEPSVEGGAATDR